VGTNPVADPAGIGGWPHSGSSQIAMLENFPTHLPPAGVVHRQYLYGGAPDRACANDVHAFKDEVLRPAITPRMEKRRNLLSQRIDPSQVRTLMQIASVACQREIIRLIGAAVLPRHDVFNMMDQVAVFLVQPAVLATLASPLPNKVPRRRIHLSIECSNPDIGGL
jgi:hypothetical protein